MSTQANGATAPQAMVVHEGRALATDADLRTDRAAFEPASPAAAYELAVRLHKGGLVPSSFATPEAVFSAIVMGRELGFTAWQSLRSIHVIEGKPSLSSAAIVALCKRESTICLYFKVIESTDEIATYETHRAGDPAPTRLSFTKAMAHQAGLFNPTKSGKPSNHTKFPAAMLRARCETALARAVYPDLAMGLYDPDELTDRQDSPTAPRNVTPPRPPVPAHAPEIVAEAPVDVVTVDAAPAQSDAFRDLSAAVAVAKSQDDLNEIAKRIGKAKAGGEFLDGEVDALKRQYAVKRDEIAGTTKRAEVA